MKRKGKESVQDLEKQIIELQRKLDRARKQTNSIWGQFHDQISAGSLISQTPERLADVMSEIIIDWANKQREEIIRKASSFRGIPPYTDCLKDLIISATNPDRDPEIPEMPIEEVVFQGSIDPASIVEDLGNSLQSKVPPPPPSQVYAPDEKMRLGPPKMMRVNVPRPSSPSPFPTDESDSG